MEIKLELATEPAVKGTIAVVACVSIAYVSTHAETPYGFASSFMIGLASSASSSAHTRRLRFAFLHAIKKEQRQTCLTRYQRTASRHKCRMPLSHKSLGNLPISKCVCVDLVSRGKGPFAERPDCRVPQLVPPPP